jgi:hypothetical protein
MKPLPLARKHHSGGCEGEQKGFRRRNGVEAGGWGSTFGAGHSLRRFSASADAVFRRSCRHPTRRAVRVACVLPEASRKTDKHLG